MMRPLHVSDILAGLALRLLAAFNVLLLAGFLATLLLVSQARAEATVCTGRDLLAQIETEEPETHARLRAEAATVLNGASLLWTVEKPGVAPSFLFGTMHLTDPRVLDLSDAAAAAFEDAETVVIETTDILDQATMLAALTARPDLMMFTDGATLTSTLPPDRARILEEGLAARGIPPASVSKMKPWMLLATFSVPTCETARRASGEQILDIQLAREARAEGKRLEGLETAADQLGAMASLPLSFHLDGLIATIQLGDLLDDFFETMVSLYERGEMGMFWPLMRATSTEMDLANYEMFEKVMIDARNMTMRDNAIPILDAGNAFIAVGALHLPGERGLVELLRAAGYRVSPAG